MCSFQTWFHDNQIGYVLECKECQKIQVGFGNILATFSVKEFERFQRQLNAVVETLVPRDNKHAKDILLQTPYVGFTIILSEAELTDLHYMVEEADNDRRAVQIMKLFGLQH
jgi:hypothetical protein